MGAGVHAKDVHGQTALRISAALGNVKGLLLADSADVSILDNDNETPLDIAGRRRGVYKPLVRVLLERSVIEHSHHLKHSRLHMAVLASHLPFMREILKSASVDVEARNVKRVCSLHLAAQGGNEGMVALLLRAGVDIYVDRDGMVPPSASTGPANSVWYAHEYGGLPHRILSM
ncbi:ankyrin repeat-containing domain protein [Tuber brumale]|nr:ankyrin repeat-containing domain protein [Tuber brumale]